MSPQSSLSQGIRRLLDKAAKALNQRQPELAERALTQIFNNRAGASRRAAPVWPCLSDAGDSAKATDFLQKAAKQRPDDATVCMYLGCALHESGALGEALIHLRRACELAPGHAPSWYNLGKALKQQAQIDDAAVALKRSLALDQRHVLARICLADIHTIRGDIVQAVAEYRHVLRLHPDQAEAWHALANLKTEPLSAVDLQQIRSAMQRKGLKPGTACSAGFQLV